MFIPHALVKWWLRQSTSISFFSMAYCLRHYFFTLIVPCTILVFMNSCANKRMYRAATTQAYINRTPPEKKYVVLEQKHFKQPLDADKIVKSLRDRTMTLQAASFDWSVNEYTFMLAVENVLWRKFELAQRQLNLLNDSDFDWQVKLLKVDCARELDLNVKVLKQYQSVYDSTQNSIVKELAKNRYRMYKYGK